MISTTMMEPNAECKAVEYLSDVKIAQILVLNKVAILQRKITALLKCSHKIVQNVLMTFLFETLIG